MKLLISYFSATGNTAQMAKVIMDKFIELGTEVDLLDTTSCSTRQENIDLKRYHAVVFGSPVHYCRAPRVFREWLQSLDGRGKKCSMFFTYGGFGVHPTHYSTRQILTEQHFMVVSSAQFLASHTYNMGGWRAMEGRPDTSDFEVAQEYARKTYQRFIGQDCATVGELEKGGYTEEKLDALENLKFKALTKFPTRDGKECSLCGLCEESCPVGAIKAETDEVDKGKCLACLRCVANCPDQVLTINDMTSIWALKLNLEKTTEEALKIQKSRIYL